MASTAEVTTSGTVDPVSEFCDSWFFELEAVRPETEVQLLEAQRSLAESAPEELSDLALAATDYDEAVFDLARRVDEMPVSAPDAQRVAAELMAATTLSDSSLEYRNALNRWIVDNCHDLAREQIVPPSPRVPVSPTVSSYDASETAYVYEDLFLTVELPEEPTIYESLDSSQIEVFTDVETRDQSAGFALQYFRMTPGGPDELAADDRVAFAAELMGVLARSESEFVAGRLLDHDGLPAFEATVRAYEPSFRSDYLMRARLVRVGPERMLLAIVASPFSESPGHERFFESIEIHDPARDSSAEGDHLVEAGA